jgi:Holliday junction resolvase RusA-like endonuclease
MTARPTVTGHLTFTVLGDPQPQGSKTLMRSRFVIESNKARLEPWRESIRTAAHAAQLASLDDYPAPGWRPLEGPIAIHLAFTMRAPKTKPRWRLYPDGRPDLDKLIRGVLDALTSIGTWLDDAQVVRIVALKTYPTDGQPPGLTVELHTIERDQW